MGPQGWEGKEVGNEWGEEKENRRKGEMGTAGGEENMAKGGGKQESLEGEWKRRKGRETTAATPTDKLSACVTYVRAHSRL